MCGLATCRPLEARLRIRALAGFDRFRAGAGARAFAIRPRSNVFLVLGFVRDAEAAIAYWLRSAQRASPIELSGHRDASRLRPACARRAAREAPHRRCFPR